MRDICHTNSMKKDYTPTEFVLFIDHISGVREVAAFISEPAAYRAYEALKGDTPSGLSPYAVLPRDSFEAYAKSDFF